MPPRAPSRETAKPETSGVRERGKILEGLRLDQALSIRIDPSEILVQEFVEREIVMGRSLVPQAKEADQSTICLRYFLIGTRSRRVTA
jgi:hypothetical protein